MAPGQARTGAGQSSPGFLPRIYWDDPAVSFSCPALLTLPSHAHCTIEACMRVHCLALESRSCVSGQQGDRSVDDTVLVFCAGCQLRCGRTGRWCHSHLCLPLRCAQNSAAGPAEGARGTLCWHRR